MSVSFDESHPAQYYSDSSLGMFKKTQSKDPIILYKTSQLYFSSRQNKLYSILQNNLLGSVQAQSDSCAPGQSLSCLFKGAIASCQNDACPSYL